MKSLKMNVPARTRELLACLAVGGCMWSATTASAQAIALLNPSFESPDVTPDPNDPNNPLNGVSPEIDDWEETGPIDPNFQTTIDTGVFFNVPIDVIPPIGNADGNNLAFMVVNTAADGINEDHVSIWQEATAQFQTGSAYAFTLSIGQSVTGAPSPEATMVLSIGYNTSPTNFVSVVDRVVTPAELKNPFDPTLIGDPNYPLLDDITVAGFVNPAAVGNEIVVKATLIGGTSGSFLVDHARLARIIPLPGDTDFDGDVDDSDLGTAFANYTGPVGAAGGKNLAQGDTDGDGDVDDSDLGSAFAGYTGPTAAPVPEPGSIALLGLAGFVSLRRRR